MKLYNTLTRTVEVVEPLNPPTVTVYTCGPTVYDYPHIGNWFTYIREDILIRTLKLAGYSPKWVMNITDVGHLVSDADEGEDKLEKGAKREGKSAWQVADFYSQYFIRSMERLGILQPDYLVKATDHIKEQIELIQKLEAKGYCYTITDGVYYDTAKFASYADFARLDLDEQQAGARVTLNAEKRSPTDFALWKFSPAGHQRDMEWDSPWGKGFPGWHIECSAMSMKYLGATLDIHAGGIDHIPVHHTNEIAQSEAATSQPFAHYWLHSNHITSEGSKISKSLGNGITLEDIEGRGISLEAFRLHVLESHYRSQSKFSFESLAASQNRLTHWYAVAALRWQPVDHPAGEAVAKHEATVATMQAQIRSLPSSLLNDLDTPELLARIDETFNKIEQTLISATSRHIFVALLKLIDQAIGINLNLNLAPNISTEQKRLINEREQARQSQDWARADELRNQLQTQGISLRDTDYGPIWYRL